MKINKLYLIAALLGTVLAGCQKEEQGVETPEEQNVKTWTLSLQADKAMDAQTKALDLTTNQETSKEMITATWSASDDHVYVYKTNGDPLGGVLNVIEGDGTASATLSGEITGNLEGVDQLMLVFPRTEWDYSTQYGLLKDDENSIESKFDYALATIDVTEDNGKLTASAASFVNQQSIYRFSFKFGGLDINTKNVELSSSTNKIVATYNPFTSAMTYSPITLAIATATTEPVYAAIKHDGNADDTFRFTVIDNDGVTYMGEKAIPSATFSNSFVSVKNVSLGQRLDAALSTTVVESAL